MCRPGPAGGPGAGCDDLTVTNAASGILEMAHSEVLTRGEGLAEDEIVARVQMPALAAAGPGCPPPSPSDRDRHSRQRSSCRQGNACAPGQRRPD